MKLSPKAKRVLLAAGAALAVLLAGAGYYIYKTELADLFAVVEVARQVIEHPEELPTSATSSILQKEILKVTLANDTNLINAAITVLDRSEIKGNPPIPSDVFSITILTDADVSTNAEDIARESALIAVLPVVRNFAGQLEDGWLHHAVGDDMFTNYVINVLENAGRGLEFFGDTEIRFRLNTISQAAFKGNIAPLSKYLEKPKKVGIIVPNLKPLTSKYDLRVTAASFVGEICVTGPSHGRILLTCENAESANKLAEAAEKFRKRALDILVGTPEEEDHLWEFSMRRLAAEYVRKVKVRLFGSTVRISGDVPDVIIRRLVAAVPRMADRLAKTRGGRSGREIENIYMGMQGPPDTVTLIEGARNVNWVRRESGQTNDPSMSGQ